MRAGWRAGEEVEGNSSKMPAIYECESTARYCRLGVVCVCDVTDVIDKMMEG